MPRPERYPSTIAAIGLHAHKGGAVAVGVSIERGEPRVVLSVSLETGTVDDRLSFEPYRLAAEMARDASGRATDEARATVAEGRRRQEHRATEGLQAIARQLEAMACKPVVIALLVNRAGWITDLLDYSLAWAEHVPVAEALAVRDAFRAAALRCGIALVELDEKSLPDRAAQVLGQSVDEMTARLKPLGMAVGKPWRKEQKLACLAAWTAVAQKH
ncbi:hypothetical protein [Dyella jiangningensis]|uniref:Uncharacterized protein n=1 Tax=Dyella jiangningensis TaxID=1379159 RepID=A0A328P184_9GAMM|nr:hypothetical protein [Dyella jiangningensis]RAO74422.1 hypothetical protein CA260_20290 [Dyella jiangningensis]